MESNRCPSCGSILPQNAQICPQCGTMLNHDSANDNTVLDKAKTVVDERNSHANTTAQTTQANYIPSKNKIFGRNLMLVVIVLLLVTIAFLVYYMMSKEKKFNDSMALINDSLAIDKNDKNKQKMRKLTAYNAFRKFVSEASNYHAYKDDMGFEAHKVGRVYYIHDINQDDIPEIIIKYDKLYENDFLTDETLLDCYRYNFTKGKVECLYNRLNKGNPAYKGTTLYTYGIGFDGYDKLIYDKESGSYSISKDCTNDYPPDITSLNPNDIQNQEPLRMAFGQ